MDSGRWEQHAGVVLRKRTDGDWDYFPADGGICHRVNDRLLAEAQNAWAKLLWMIAILVPIGVGIWIAALLWHWGRTTTMLISFGSLAVAVIAGFLLAHSRVQRILRQGPISEAALEEGERKSISRKLAMRNTIGRSWALSTPWGLWIFAIASGLMTAAGVSVAVSGLLKGDREEFWIGARGVLFFGGGALLLIFLRRRRLDAAQRE